MIKFKTAKEFEKLVKPNTFITLTIKQGIYDRFGAYMPGSSDVYDRVIRSLLSRVHRRLYGKRAWRRRRHQLPNLTVLEKGKDGRWHIHSCLKRPAHVTIEELIDIVEECWSVSDWYMPRYEIEEYRGGGVSYILKDGQDAILVGPTYF
jgi:hypothetical protein